MHPYLSSETARTHQAEIRRGAEQARLARAVLASPGRTRRPTLGKFRRPTLVAVDVRGLRPA